MKKYFLNIFCMALAVSLSGILASCHDDDPPVEEDENTDAVYEIPDLATEDLMQTTTKVPLFVPSTSGISDVGLALIRRCPAAFDYSEAGAVLLTAVGIDDLDEATMSQIKDFYNAGGMIIMDRPTPYSFRVLERGLGLDEIDDPMEEHDDHEAYGIYAFNKHFDIYKLNDIFDEEGSEYQAFHEGTEVDEDGNTTPVNQQTEGVTEGCDEQPLTPYFAGTIADPLAQWMTENTIPEQWREARKQQIIANSRDSMDDIIHAQSVTNTWTHGVSEWWKDKCSDKIWETLKDRQTVFTTTTRIYVAYSYDQDTDYYLFDQVVWANNSHKWLGSWSTGKYDHQGLYLYGLTIQNRMLQGAGWGNYVTQNDGLILQDFSPETTIGATTYSSSSGYSFGGNVGLTTSGPTVNYNWGINASVSQSYSIPDIKITAKCGDDATLGNNCKWEYRAPNHNYDVDWKNKATFYSPAQISINTIKVGQSWVWKLEHPKRFDNTTLYLRYSLSAWMGADYRKWNGIFRSKDWGCDGLITTHASKIAITMPNRNPDL